MESDRVSTPAKLDAVVPPKITAPRVPSLVAKSSWRWLIVRMAMVGFSACGLLIVSYVVGAAVMFFQFPSSAFLTKSFMGVRAWNEKRIGTEESSESSLPVTEGLIDNPAKTFDGYTLFACASLSAPSTRVSLIDMKRETVHEWSVSFSKIWPNPPQLQGRQVDDSQVCIFATHLYPNGDLLVVFHSLELTVSGYGLVKVDKDSNLIWSYAAKAHHDVAVDEDGKIYTLVQRTVTERPRGLDLVPAPWVVDDLAILSPEGKELRQPISLLDSLVNSPYAKLLSALETPFIPTAKAEVNDKTMRELRTRQDVLHANSVNVLSKAAAAKFPNFKAGQVLISLRNIHALAIVDPQTGAIEWAASGPWHFQHDAQFLNDGNIMIFDNIGSPRGSRVLEYEPGRGSFPWCYPGPDNAPFYSNVRGMAQRLPNGNTLIVNSEGHEMMEVTAQKEEVWTCKTNNHIATARRYSPTELTFLKPGRRPRK